MRRWWIPLAVLFLIGGDAGVTASNICKRWGWAPSMSWKEPTRLKRCGNGSKPFKRYQIPCYPNHRTMKWMIFWIMLNILFQGMFNTIFSYLRGWTSICQRFRYTRQRIRVVIHGYIRRRSKIQRLSHQSWDGQFTIKTWT